MEADSNDEIESNEQDDNDSDDGDFDEPEHDSHDVYGPCSGACGPGNYDDIVDEDHPRYNWNDCVCEGPCNRCKIIQQRRPDWKVLRGDDNGPLRMKLNPPVDPSTLAAEGRCTEMIPWNSSVKRWKEQCENTSIPRRNRGRNSKIRHCEELTTGKCQDQDTSEQDPPGLPEDGARKVCTGHVNDQKKYWKIDAFYAAHLVPVCAIHHSHFRGLYPDGFNSCTCANLLNRWQCRRCFEWNMKCLRRQFRKRVLANPINTVDRALITGMKYHKRGGWRHVRAMLSREHHCANRLQGPQIFENHNFCGEKRLRAHKADVMDCRACGGLIVKSRHVRKAAAKVPTRTGVATRSRARADRLLELNRRGQPHRVEDEDESSVWRPRRVREPPPPPPVETEGDSEYERDVVDDPTEWDEWDLKLEELLSEMEVDDD